MPQVLQRLLKLKHDVTIRASYVKCASGVNETRFQVPLAPNCNLLKHVFVEQQSLIGNFLDKAIYYNSCLSKIILNFKPERTIVHMITFPTVTVQSIFLFSYKL